MQKTLRGRTALFVGTRLQAAGYNTALIGKYLNRYGIMKSRVTGKSSVHYVPRGLTHWMVGLDNGWGGDGGTYNYFNFTQNIDGRTVHHKGAYSSDVVAGETRQVIREFAKSSKPFFLWVTPVAPHFGMPREPDDPKPTVTRAGRRISFDTAARPHWVKGLFNRQITHAMGVRANGKGEEADVSHKPRNIKVWPEMTATDLTATIIDAARARRLPAWTVPRGCRRWWDPTPAGPGRW